MATSVVSGRVSTDVKAKADRVIRRHGLTVGDVIKSVWTVIAETGELPEAAQPDKGYEPDMSAFDSFVAFVTSLPPVPKEYANLSDERVREMLGERDV